MIWKIGLIGFGNVGQGFIRILAMKKSILEKKYGFKYKVIAIADPIKGNAYSENGLDLKMIIKLLDEKGDIKDIQGYKDFDSIMLAKDKNVDVIIEVTPTNIKNGEPGLTHIRSALENGKHVVTSNKGPIALAYNELRKLAEKRNVYLRFEGTVMSGTPALSLARESLAGCDIIEVEGILNGTTNFILTKMEEGVSYEDALAEAQKLGYAETDPTADVEGWDAAVKTVVIANTLMGGNVSIKDINREGITRITLEDIEDAKKKNMKIKLVAHAYKENNLIKASVKPTRLPLSHPLSNIVGVLNAITFTTDNLGKITLIGPGAGRVETGQALLSDILYIHRVSSSPIF